MRKMVAEVVYRSQHRKMGKRGFGGPDTYVAVVIREEGGEPVGSHPLSRANEKRFLWEIRRIGEGYSKHSGPRSQLGKAIRMAEKLKEEMENEPANGD